MSAVRGIVILLALSASHALAGPPGPEAAALLGKATYSVLRAEKLEASLASASSRRARRSALLSAIRLHAAAAKDGRTAHALLVGSAGPAGSPYGRSVAGRYNALIPRQIRLGERLRRLTREDAGLLSAVERSLTSAALDQARRDLTDGRGGRKALP